MRRWRPGNSSASSYCIVDCELDLAAGVATEGSYVD